MLTLSEYILNEPVPLHRVQEAIFDFCRQWQDAVIFGAQAVNAHLPDEHARMTQDVDILSREPEKTADALASTLLSRLGIAARVRRIVQGKAFRVYQKRSDGDPRHLADIRLLEFDVALAPVVQDGIRFVSLHTLIAMKIVAVIRRGTTAKGLTDHADLRRLLLAHPTLRNDPRVAQTIAGIYPNVAASMAKWAELLAAPVTDNTNDPEWPDD